VEWFQLGFSCFPSLLNANSLTRKISFHREWRFGYGQETKQADLAGQKLLFGVNCLFYNKDTWIKRTSFLLFLKLLPYVFPVKVSAFDASKCCLENHNDGFLQTGDLKPNEYPMDFFLTMAWNPTSFHENNLQEYARKFCAEQFGAAEATEASEILSTYCKFNSRITAEMMNHKTYNLESGEFLQVKDAYLALKVKSF